jgi:hypothetical protein
MGGPELYQRYDRDEAIALFGSESESRSLCDGQWIVFPHVVIGLSEIGGPPRASHFTCGGGFCWVARKPYRVSDDEPITFVPPEAVSSHADRPIRLFVRPIDSGRYLYVGDLDPACRFSISGEDNHGEACFSLSPALPSEVWGEIGGYQPGDLDHASIDAALDRLRQPLKVEERLRVVRRLVEYWHGPIRPEDGIPESELSGVAMPDPLRWWYRWAGRRPKIMTGQNVLLDPNKLMVKDDRLVFYGENQWCYEWATLFEGDDPPVFGREEEGDPWEPEGIVLSEHLILACLFEGMSSRCPYKAAASWLEGSVLDRLVEHLPRSRSSRGGGADRPGSMPGAEPSCTRCRMARSTAGKATRSGSGPRPSTRSGSLSPSSPTAGSTPPFEANPIVLHSGCSSGKHSQCRDAKLSYTILGESFAAILPKNLCEISG